MNKALFQKVLNQQQNEINEHFVYKLLAEKAEDEENKKILNQIAEEEYEHYLFWKSITKKELEPKKSVIKKFEVLANIFGLSFALRLMEKGEEEAGNFYASIAKEFPEVKKIQADEESHEDKLIGILNDYRLLYAGAIVLGLNDALVEFTGTLAGLTFAFSNNKIIGITGLIMGVAASLSMAALGYLASKEDMHEETTPITSAIYTGTAYIFTVTLLALPYLLQPNPYLALALMLLITVLIIALYTFYISIAKNLSFKRRFLEMSIISISVSVISFGIGTIIKNTFNIDV